jgi:hypothetical protein
MRKAAMVLMVCLMAGQQALAGDEGSAKKSEGTVEKVGEEAGHGITKGAEAAGRGIRKGGEAAGQGIEKAAGWLERKLGKGGGKKDDQKDGKKEGDN